MGLWDEDDRFTRWVHAVCAIPVLAFLAFDGYLLYLPHSYGLGASSFSRTSSVEAVAFCGALYLSGRLLWYAATGRNCINRDYFD